MIENVTLPTAGLIVVNNNNKILLAYSKNKKAWYLPGGKIDKGENSINSLQREIKEELNIKLVPELLKFYCHITAPAFGEKANVIMEQDCFLYELNEEIQPSNEIEKVDFFSFEEYQSELTQVIGVLEIFKKLTYDKILF